MLKLRLLLLFYQQFAAVFILVSIVCCYIMWSQHTLSSMVLFLPLKVFSDAVFIYFWYVLRSRELYFYLNLSLRKRELFAGALLLDILLFLVLTLVTARLI